MWTVPSRELASRLQRDEVGEEAASKINSKDHFSKSTLITRRGATWRKVRQQKGNVLALRSAVGLVKELQVKRGELSQESSLHTQQQRLFLWLWWQVVGGWWPDLQGLPAGKAGFIRPLPLCFSPVITSASAWSTISLLLPLVHNHTAFASAFSFPSCLSSMINFGPAYPAQAQSTITEGVKRDSSLPQKFTRSLFICNHFIIQIQLAALPHKLCLEKYRWFLFCQSFDDDGICVGIILVSQCRNRSFLRIFECSLYWR